MGAARFTHGVASAGPTTDGVVLWTRAVPDDPMEPCSVDWWIRARTSEFEAAGSCTAEPADDHTVRVLVDGMPPGTEFTYGFSAAGQSSTIGATRTLPDAPQAFTIAYLSCAKFNAGHFNAYRHLAGRRDVDLVLHLGDYIYEAAQVPAGCQTPGADIDRPFDPTHECRTLDDYRRRYRQYRGDPDLQALHAAHPIIATLDDHELADNAWSGGADEHVDSRDGPWPARMRAALRAWREWVPSRVSGEDVIHRDVTLGGLARILLLEARTQRSDPAGAPEHRSQLGPAQREWLLDQLAHDDVAWQVLVSPSILTPVWRKGLPDEARAALRALKMVGLDEDEPFVDSWDHYATERDRIIDALCSSPTSALVLSGDVHVGIEAVLSRDAGQQVREFVTPSVTSQNLDDKRGWSPGDHRSTRLAAAVRDAVDGIEWFDPDSHGYVTVTLTPECARVSWWAVDTVLRRADGATCVRTTEVPVST